VTVTNYNHAIYLSRTPVIHCVRTHRTNTWWDEHLTEDNASFLKKSITDEYQQLTADKLNPLKDDPWPRHEWVEGGSGHNAHTFKDLFIDPENLTKIFLAQARLKIIL